MVLDVEDDDNAGCLNGGDEDGDDGGRVSVHIGHQNVLQANIYAPNGTLVVEIEDASHRAIIGQHLRVGPRVKLALDSAFN